MFSIYSKLPGYLRSEVLIKKSLVFFDTEENANNATLFLNRHFYNSNYGRHVGVAVQEGNKVRVAVYWAKPHDSWQHVEKLLWK